MDSLQKSMLEKIADLHEVPEGAYNIRSNGALAARNTTASTSKTATIQKIFNR